MFLRSLVIKNYRSLEDVRLEKLGRFNVLIGRNNSGKSSVFGALQLLNTVIRGGGVEAERVLTDLDPNRSLEIMLTFEPRQQDREEFANLVATTEAQKGRRKDMLNSSLARQVEFVFRAPAGRPELLHLRQTKVRTEDNLWAIVQRMEEEGEDTVNPPSRVLHLDSLGSQFSHGVVLDQALLDIDLVVERRAPLVTQMIMRGEMSIHAQNPQQSSYPAGTWPQGRLVKYLGDAFFFDPFRHSVESAGVQQTPGLGQDGSNLAQVLHTINSNDRSKFQEIEHFVQAALPDIGTLQTPLEGTSTRVSFRCPPGGYRVRLHDMGGGIEQLLMAAIVLLTTGDESTLFLEEPESHLHPGAQRFLIERLYEGDRQIFVTTHSPAFVNLSRPRSLYQITYAEGRTTIGRMGDADSLGAVLEDIGARNSDVLLSDAVLFVEGPSDRDTLRVWSEKLEVSLEENNVTVLPMGGGEFAERGAGIRSQVLEGISEKAHVPHLFVVDRDERNRDEMRKLQQALAGRVHVLESRELENYLLVPRVLMTAISAKHRDDAPTLEKIAAATEEQVEQLIRTTAEGLYGLVLLKRVRAALGGLKGGLLPRELANTLTSHVHSPALPEVVSKEIESRVTDHLIDLNVEKIVIDEKKALDEEWGDSESHVRLAPGAEIVAAVFHHFGSEYRKPRDTLHIAQQMRPDEIPSEIKQLIKQAVSLSSTERGQPA